MCVAFVIPVAPGFARWMIVCLVPGGHLWVSARGGCSARGARTADCLPPLLPPRGHSAACRLKGNRDGEPPPRRG